jgi:hypothetical protein
MRRSIWPYRFLTFPAAVLALLLAGCGRQPASTSAPVKEVAVLATVGGQTVTEADFRRAWQQQLPAADTPEARQQVLDALITRAAQVDAARRAGVERNPEIRDEIERLLIAGLRQTQLQPHLDSTRVGEEELQAYFEQHRQTSFTQPGQDRVAVLWFDTRGQGPLAARFRPRLNAARAQVLADPSAFPVAQGFGALAVTNSEHRVSRYRGGDVGWLTASAAGTTASGWNPAVQGIARTLRVPGDLSEVVESPEGLFLVRLIARRPGGVADYASVRERIAQDLHRERRQRLEADFLSGILAASLIQRQPAALAAVDGLTTNHLAIHPLRPGPPELPDPPADRRP